MAKGNGNQQASENQNDSAVAEATARAEAAEAAATEATARAEKAENDLATAYELLDDASDRVTTAEAALAEGGESTAKQDRGEEIDFLADDYDGPMTGEIAEARHKHAAARAAAAADEK